MKLTIDGKTIEALPGMTLLELIDANFEKTERLSERPLAAKIAGEVFNLNYIPVRVSDVCRDRTSIRRAMEASQGVVHLLRYADPSGTEVYRRTVQFVLFLAIWQLWPKAHAIMDCTVGGGLYVEVTGAEDFSADKLKRQVAQIVRENIPLIRRRVRTEDAIAQFRQMGWEDKARLLSWRKAPVFDEYAYGDFADYYYGELAPSTGYMTVWDILPAQGGFLFLFPDGNCPDRIVKFEEKPNLLQVSREGRDWCELMQCQTVADLNEIVKEGRIRELIRVNEALHEKSFAQVADEVCRRNAGVVLLAGPSSSGKTTSAHRLATQLRVHGKMPILIGLDDYYIDRDKIPPEADGQPDLEHIRTIDTGLFRENIRDLFAGKEVQLPSFNFITGKREWHGKLLRLTENTVIIAEGLHALNPILSGDEFPKDSVFRLAVSPLIPLNLDEHNRIPSGYVRLLRRIVRDHNTRGASVEQTLSMWDSVRRGEQRWIFPFQENADWIFNSATLYELSVLKRHIFPLLAEIQPEQSCYEQVRAIVKILNYVTPTDADDEIPPTSLVREFIGGNSFYR